MIAIKKLDHIGIRIRDKQRSVSFYETLGFEMIEDKGFEQGHPVTMRHSCGIELNLLGPTSTAEDNNILMDIAEKHAGYTHIALQVTSIEETVDYFNKLNYTITERMQFKNMKALFIRDPDRNVLEFDEYLSE